MLIKKSIVKHHTQVAKQSKTKVLPFDIRGKIKVTYFYLFLSVVT